jgi:hypothetical protein
MKTLLIASLLWTVAAHAQAPLSDAEFSRTFRCPETLPTDDDRKETLQAFLTWAAKRHPDLTVQKVVELRMKMIEEHRCKDTLSNIQSSATAGRKPRRSLCTRNDGSRYFSDQAASNCSAIPLDSGWVNFQNEPRVLVDIMPSTRVKKHDGTKIWTRFFLAEPVASSDGRWRYDALKSVTKYYCGTKQQRLIQGTYMLNGRPVYERSSAESLLEEIEPGTLAEGLYEYACRK